MDETLELIVKHLPFEGEVSTMLPRFAALFGLLFLAAGTQHTLAADKTGVTDNSIKIGLFGPMTGQSNIGAKPVYGAASIYKDVNDKGGIHGRKIEIIIEDDGYDGNKRHCSRQEVDRARSSFSAAWRLLQRGGASG